MPVTILPNNSAIRWTTGAAEVSSARGTVPYEGAGFEVLFSGTTLSLTFNTAVGAGIAPQVLVDVDGESDVYAVASSVAIVHADLPDRLHLLRVTVKGVDYYEGTASRLGSVGTPPNVAAHLTGIILDTGASVAAPYAPSRPRILVLGDSNTAGQQAVEGANDVEYTDGTLAFPARLGRELGADVTGVGLSGQGYTIAGLGVGVASSSYAKVTADTARDLTPYSLIVLAWGLNDSDATDADVTAAAAAIGSAILTTAPSARVLFLQPLRGTKGSAIQAAAAAVGSPRATYLSTAGWMETSDSPDTYYYYGFAHAKVARRLGDAIRTLGLLAGPARRTPALRRSR